MDTHKRHAAHIRTMRRQRSPDSGARYALFTAVEGTLLEAQTFDAGRTRATLRRLEAEGVPVVPVTGMTLAESEPIARELGLRHAMIIEAGGAIARWTEGRWEVEACGTTAEALLDVVREIEDRSGAYLTVYSALSPADAERLSGRSGVMLEHSTHRLFSEPFVIEKGDIREVVKAAASIGFSVRRGRRFLHLRRRCDEGQAFTRVRADLRCDVAIAVGGSPIDAEFLSRAEVPIIVPRALGKPDLELRAKVPHARIAPLPGPAGWAAAVNDVWRGIAAPRRSRTLAAHSPL